MGYIALFFAGAFLCNCMPHLSAGLHQMVLTLNARGSSEGNQGSPAASKCSLIQNTCQHYLNPIRRVIITVQRY